MEIERKFTIRSLPDGLDACARHHIEQGYLSADPVVRVRREDERYYMTCKGRGLLAHEELEMALTPDAYRHLLSKADGIILTKTRYLIPIAAPRFADGYTPASDPALRDFAGLTVELDVFEGQFTGLIIAEVEFPTLLMAQKYLPEPWFREDVTSDLRFHNSSLSAVSDPAAWLAEFQTPAP